VASKLYGIDTKVENTSRSVEILQHKNEESFYPFIGRQN